MLTQEINLAHPLRFTPQKSTTNTKAVERMVQAFLFNQTFSAKNQSSMMKSFDSASSQKLILQGEIELLMLMIKHLKHLYSRKQLENKNLEMHLEHYKKVYKQVKLENQDQTQPKQQAQNSKLQDLHARTTLKKTDHNPFNFQSFQSFQSSISCFQDQPKTVKANEQIQDKNVKSLMVLQNRQLKQCLQQRDQKISDLSFKNDKLKVSFKNLFEQLKMLAKQKERLIIEQNIASLKFKNQKGQLQFENQNIKNQKQCLEENIVLLKNRLQQQDEKANYKEQCQFLRNCFKKQLDNNYQLNSSKIKLIRKIAKLQKIIKEKINSKQFSLQNCINQNNRQGNQNKNQQKIGKRNPMKLKFYKDSQPNASHQNQAGSKLSHQSQSERKLSKMTVDQKSKHFKKSPHTCLIIDKQEESSRAIRQNCNIENLLGSFSLQNEQQNNERNSKLQFLFEKLTQYSMRLQQLTHIIQMTKNQNSILKDQIKSKNFQKDQQINSIKKYFQNQLNSIKKNSESAQNQANIIRLSQNKDSQKSQSFNLIQNTFKKIQFKQYNQKLNQPTLQKKIAQKQFQNANLIKQIQLKQEEINKLKDKIYRLAISQNVDTLTDSNLRQMILTERKKVTIRYDKPFEQIHEHEKIRIHSNHTQLNLRGNKFQNQCQTSNNNPMLLDNFNIFRCKLTQFYENVINQLDSWQTVQLNQIPNHSLPQSHYLPGNIICNQQKQSIPQKQVTLSQQKFQKNSKNQDMNSSRCFEEAIQDILMRKMEQFQLFSNSLNASHPKESNNIFEQLKSCKSQYQEHSQIISKQICEPNSFALQKVGQSQKPLIFCKDEDCLLKLIKSDNFESKQKESNSQKSSYLSKFGFIDGLKF